MKTITTSADNWSGKDIEVNVYAPKGKRQEFEVHGNRFLMVTKDHWQDEELGMGCQTINVFPTDRKDLIESNVPSIVVRKWDDENQWEATMDLRFGRSHEDPVLAAAKVVASTY